MPIRIDENGRIIDEDRTNRNTIIREDGTIETMGSRRSPVPRPDVRAVNKLSPGIAGLIFWAASLVTVGLISFGLIAGLNSYIPSLYSITKNTAYTVSNWLLSIIPYVMTAVGVITTIVKNVHYTATGDLTERFGIVASYFKSLLFTVLFSAIAGVALVVLNFVITFFLLIVSCGGIF